MMKKITMLWIVSVFLFLSCEKETNNDYRFKILGDYYCIKTEKSIVNRDSSLLIPDFKPRIVTKIKNDTIQVSLSNLDSMIVVDGATFFLDSDYTFRNLKPAQMFQYSGKFVNDSLYFYFYSYWGDEFVTKGKTK